jgi:hypothetical protein
MQELVNKAIKKLLTTSPIRKDLIHRNHFKGNPEALLTFSYINIPLFCPKDRIIFPFKEDRYDWAIKPEETPQFIKYVKDMEILHALATISHTRIVKLKTDTNILLHRFEVVVNKDTRTYRVYAHSPYSFNRLMILSIQFDNDNIFLSYNSHEEQTLTISKSRPNKQEYTAFMGKALINALEEAKPALYKSLNYLQESLSEDSSFGCDVDGFLDIKLKGTVLLKDLKKQQDKTRLLVTNLRKDFKKFFRENRI